MEALKKEYQDLRKALESLYRCSWLQVHPCNEIRQECNPDLNKDHCDPMWARFGRSLHLHPMILWRGDHDLRWSKTPKTDAFVDDCVRAVFDLCSSPGHEGSKSIWRLGVRPDLSIRPGQTRLIYFDFVSFWFFSFSLEYNFCQESVWGKTHDGERRRGLRKLWR